MIENIIDWLLNNNIEPFYFFAIVCSIIVISYHKEFKNWDKIYSWQKSLISVAVAAAVFFVFVSLLMLTGIINFD